MTVKIVKAYQAGDRIYKTFEEAVKSSLEEISLEVYDAVFDIEGKPHPTSKAIRLLKKALQNGLKTISGVEKE